MKEFLLIIRGGDDESGHRSPEEMQKHMQHWQRWMSGLAEEGKFVGGQPLKSEGKTIVEGGSRVIDRPLAEGKELVGGYLLIHADSLEDATNISKDCPGFEYNCSVEVREISPM
ncbi:YciI family protein [Aquimarina celericrescens]|uniref:YciI family protein n=1 Tax=Aquimarina celericrescens TaxID=1964542 RepID=A0ABW5AYK5_9FLAO|nr:hypothetical protein [Aquimarina celericrescens]